MIGFLTFDRMNTEIYMESTKEGLSILTSCDFNQFELKPGAMIKSETISFDMGSDYHYLLI